VGRRKRDGNYSPQKNNLIQDSEENEENGYPIPDSNKTKTNDTKEPSDAHKNTLKDEILQVITEKNVQDALKKFQDTKNKDYKKTQKQIN
jgi:hypothetical protein